MGELQDRLARVVEGVRAAKALPVDALQARERVAFVVLGKPGAGKSSLAERIVTHLALHLVQPRASVERAFREPGHPAHAWVKSTLSKGGEIPAAKIIELMRQDMLSEHAKFKGFVVDGLPLVPTSAEGSAPLSPDESGMTFLKELLNSSRPGCQVVPIDLRISEADAVRRLASLSINPDTQLTYSAAQVAYSRKRWLQGYIEPAEAVDMAGSPEYQGALGGEGGASEGGPAGAVTLGEEPEDSEGSDEDDTSTDDEDGDEDGEDGNGAWKKRRAKFVPPPPRPLQNVVSWRVLSQAVVGRLLRIAEYSGTAAEAHVKAYTQALAAQPLPVHQGIHLDATRTADMVYDGFVIALKNRNLFHRFPIPMPLHLNPLAIGYQTSTEIDVQQYFAGVHCEANLPKRELSPFQRYCPVAYAEGSGTLVECDWSRVVAYKGFLFLLSTSEALAKFLAHPDRYLGVTPKPAPFTISFSGPALSGCSSQAAMLASLYNLKLVAPEVILRDWGTTPDYQKRYPSAYKCLKELKFGKTAPMEPLMEIIKVATRDVEKEGFAGWALSGFPRTADEAQALANAGVVPKYAVVFQVDPKDKTYKERVQRLEVHPDGVTLESPVRAYPFHADAITAFQGEVGELNRMLKEYDIKLVPVLTSLDLPAALATILVAVDPLLPRARMLQGDNDAAELGTTKDYCPVSLRRKGILMKGNPRLQALFNGRRYLFGDEESRDAFLVDPFTYAARLTPADVPPPRIVFIGPSSSGKSSLAQGLGQKSLPFIDMPAYFAEYVSRAPTRLRQALTDSYNQDTGFTSAAIAQDVLQTLFSPQPAGVPSHHQTGFLLENYPRCPVEMDVLLNQFHVDAIVSMELEPELCVPRILKQMIAATRARGGQWTMDEDQEDDLKEQLIEKSNKESVQYSDLTSVLENSSIPFLGLDGTRSMRYSLAKLRRFLAPFLGLRANLLLQAVPIRTPTHLAHLLQSGVARYTAYGTQCPVSYMRGERFLDGMAYLHQGYVYHVHPKYAPEFVQNVSAYLALPVPRLAMQPSLCVLGPPMTGKQTLAAKLAELHGLVLLTPEVVVQSILDGQEETLLHDQAIILVTRRLEEVGRGWVMMGYPETMEQVRALQAAGWKPKAMYQLAPLSEAELATRITITYLRDTSAGNITQSYDELVRAATARVLAQLPELQAYFTETCANWEVVDCLLSRWAAREQVDRSVKELTSKHEVYADLRARGKACAIHRVGLGIATISAHYSRFGVYCPVQFQDYGELSLEGMDRTEWIAEYRNLYYVLSSAAALATFLAAPDSYVTGKPFPADLPQALTPAQVKESFPLVLELQGYCPVTFAEVGRDQGPLGFDGIVPGSTEFAARYKSKVYTMASAARLGQFMKTPWRYENLVLPKKLPPPSVHIPIGALPQIGYLEQTVATLLTKALTVVGKAKPKFPYKSMEASALEYLALYLKANNERSKDWLKKSYSKRLTKYQEQCSLLQTVCSILQQEQAGAGTKRSAELEQQMQAFMGYKPAGP